MIKTYRNRKTKQLVQAMKYDSIDDFDSLYDFIGDVIVGLTPAHTRVYEGQWVIRHRTNRVEWVNCYNENNCFERSYELYM